MVISSFALILNFFQQGPTSKDLFFFVIVIHCHHDCTHRICRRCQIENWIKPEAGGDLLPMQQELDCGAPPSQWHNGTIQNIHNGTIRNIKFISGRIGTNASIQMSNPSLKLQHIWKTPPKSGWWWLAGWLTVPLLGGKKHETINAPMPRVT